MENTQVNSAENKANKSKRKTSFLILFLILLVIGGGWFAYYEIYAKPLPRWRLMKVIMLKKAKY